MLQPPPQMRYLITCKMHPTAFTLMRAYIPVRDLKAPHVPSTST